jgi:hypothetical protein
MAVTLSSTLAAHQQGRARRPHLSAQAYATRAGSPVLRWSRIYSGAEADNPHALATTASGAHQYVVRARNTAGTVYTSSQDYNASPSWSSWSNTIAATSGAPVALAAIAAETILVYVANAGLDVRIKTSTDNGATWSASTTLVTEASAIGFLAVAFNPLGDVCVFYTLGTTTTLKRLRRTSGTWAGAGTNWSKSASVATLSGLSACHDGADFNLVITGTEVTTTNPRAWATRMGDLGLTTNAWGSLVSVAEADSLGTTTFKAPSLSNLVTDFAAFFTQSESANVPFDRAMYSRPVHAAGVQGGWSEPAPHEATGVYGVAVAWSSGTSVFAAQPGGLWHASVSDSCDLSDRVVSGDYRITPTSSRCSLELDNHDGLLVAALHPASFPGFATGNTLRLTPGYASVEAPPPDDSFNRADNTTSLGSTDTGQPWVALSGVWGIYNNHGMTYDGAYGQHVAAFDCAWADFDLSAVIAKVGLDAGFVVRASDDNNYILIGLGTTEGCGVWKKAGGSWTNLIAYDNLPWADGDTIRIVTSGDTITVYRNGALWNTFTEAFNNTATMVGIRDNDTWPVSQQVDSLRVVPDYASRPGWAVETGVVQEFIIRAITHHIEDGRAFTTVECDGAWEQLDRWHAPQAWQTAAAVLTRQAIFQRVAARAGLYWSLGTSPAAPSSDWSAYSPAFAIAAGESGATILKRLLAVVTDYVRANGGTLEAVGTVGGSAAQTFSTGTPYALTFEEQAPQPHNWTRVQGPDRYADSVAFADVYAHGPVLDIVRNLDATTNAKASAWAANAAARDVIERPFGQLVIPFHAGLQLFDHIAGTDPRLGTFTSRIAGIAMRYRRGPKPAYDSILTLGGPTS